MSKDLGASDENLIQKSDDESHKKRSFFDNTIDESENDVSIVNPAAKVDEKMSEKDPEDSQAGQSEEKNVFAKDNRSFMEIEVKKDKQRWLYMSELGGIFGEEKHTREGFIKIFGNRVSENLKKIESLRKFGKVLCKSFLQNIIKILNCKIFGGIINDL